MKTLRRDGISATILAGLLTLTSPALAQDQDAGDADGILADGTVIVRSFELPPSDLLSEEAKKHLPRTPNDPSTQMDQLVAAGKVPQVRPMIPKIMAPQIDPLKAAYGVKTEVGEIAGVPAVFFEPEDGVPEPNKGKIMLNLPGGGFIMGHAGGTGSVESIPLSAIAGVKIVSITYRQGPEYTFPAASEDVGKVYRELLKTYKPEDIAIFGCSAGGMLAAQSMAWFAKEGLPFPSSIGIFCAGAEAELGGDSTVWNRPIEALPDRQSPRPYYEGIDRTDPLVSPVRDPALLASFPPTLYITASRAFEMSKAAYSHRKQVEAGGNSQLLIWDGLTHAFFYDPALPESREAFDAQAKFFAEHLGLELPKGK